MIEVVSTPVLLLLGRGKDPESERGVDCPGDLPAPSDPGLVERARAAKEALGDRVFVLGHHYQRDEVIQFADVTGDSFKLAREAAARPGAEFIVFCGVHFMAESADILTSEAPEGRFARPRGRVLDGRHGRPRTGGEGVGAVAGQGIRRLDDPGDLHELLGRHQGLRGPQQGRRVHLVQRQARPGMGFLARREGALPPRSASRPQHGDARARVLGAGMCLV
jgi:hypothetical protein